MEFAKLKPDKGILSYSWNHQAHIATGPHYKLFLGVNTIDHAQVIIKHIENSNISDIESFADILKDIKKIQSKKLQGCVQYVDLTRSQDCFYFIQSFCKNGDLRQFMSKKGKIEEHEATKIIQTLIKSFQNFNKEGLIHGNLKPENIQIHNKAYLLNDYSLSNYNNFFLSDKKQENNENFLYYSTQQLSKANYKLTAKSDIWSLGLIFYEMLYGTLPWNAKSKAEYLQTIKKIPIRFPFNLPISEISKDFIKGCLQVEENTRFNWDQIFKHPIFSSENNLGSNDANNKIFNVSPKSMKVIKELQNVIAKQNLDLEKLFLSFDRTGDKSLDLHEFMKLIVVIQPKMEMQDIQEIFQKFDENHDGNISFSEFKKLILETDYRENTENEQLAEFRGQKILEHIINVILENNLDLDKMISQFDVTGDKLLKFGEFLPIIRVFDNSISEQDGKFVFKKFDQNLDGELSCQEFKIILEIEIEKRSKNVKTVKKKPPKSLTMPEKILLELRNVIVFNKIDIKLVFTGFDKSGDGLLDFKEFKEVVAIINARHTEPNIKELFNLFDANKDGTVSLDEFKNTLLAE